MRVRGVSPLYTAIILLVFLLPNPIVHATSNSIPIAGRYSTLVIGIRIPGMPKWAHDTILNATTIWNEAQEWYESSVGLHGRVYLLEESNEGSATISFTMPEAYSKIAVGWTNYQFASGTRTILSTQSFLDPSIFGVDDSGNLTAQRYGFWLALHELGRVMGLGSVLDGRDIMDPRATSNRATQPPVLSTLDLYALDVLASGSTPSYVTLPIATPNQFVDATSFISTRQNGAIPTPEFNGFPALLATISLAAVFVCLRRRRS